MKKIIAVAVVALLMFAFAASAFALLPISSPTYKNPPVFIDGLVVSDAWMSGLTTQNWKAALTNQAYAEGSYIWFVAKVGVAANGDTDAQHFWDGNAANGGESADLTFTGLDNCLNFTPANMATFARIWNMSVDARSIWNNQLSIVEAKENSARFTFTSELPFGMDGNRVLMFNPDLANLEMDAIYPANVWFTNTAGGLDWWTNTAAGNNRATNQKDFYLHFMAITKAATQGVCIGTMKVNGEDTFTRAVQTHPWASYSQTSWWASDSTTFSNTQLLPGDRSNLYLLFNTVNGKEYSIMKISNEAVGQNAAVKNVGPYGGGGVMYVLMNKEATEVVCGFVVDGGYVGLTKWNASNNLGRFFIAAPGTPIGMGTGTTADPLWGMNARNWNRTTAEPYGYSANTGYGALPYAGIGTDSWFYEAAMSNDLSNSVVDLTRADFGGLAVSKTELQAIFDFFGFAYVNPRAPGDADFLARTGLVTVAEAKYNVANAVITTPDTSIVIPKTGDAATSTGIILVASAILAAAAVGFVLSKRAHN